MRVAPITCRRNVPALPSVSGPTPSGRASRSPEASGALPGESAQVLERVSGTQALAVMRVYEAIDAGSGSIT